jgi:glycosyltransferase involved in cell wall biosynthesis
MMNSSYVGNPEVSVLMSCYNGSRWLHEAIDSILAQTFDNFEFILVDDGSTDDTLNICRSYRDRDERIVILSKQSTGLADSLNFGIRQAKGTWIARLDQDDIAEPTRFEEQINFVRNHLDVVLLGTGFLEIDEQGYIIKKHLYPSGHYRLVRHLEHLQRFFPHSSALYRTEVVRLIGGYNLRIHRAEDWRLWLELSLRGKIACLSKSLVRIRKHSSQMSQDNKGLRQFCDARAATICHLLRKEGRKDPSLNASDDEWIEFLNWVEKRILQSGAFEKRKVWENARTEYFTADNRLAGLLLFSKRLWQSGHLRSLMWEKIFGSALPGRLTQEWISIVR